MGINRFGPPKELICKLKKTYHIETFIETGTYHGGTAYWASGIFERVLTVEAAENLYNEVTEKYRHIKNIEFIYGDSGEKLGDIVGQLSGPSVFWLDAHWSGTGTHGEDAPGPLIDEIEIINTSNYEHFILIDDARLFMSPPPDHLSMDQWPNIATVINALEAFGKERYIVIIEDVIIAVPAYAKMIVARYCQDVNTKFWKEFGTKSKNDQNGLAKKRFVSKEELVDKLRSRAGQLTEAKAEGDSEAEIAWVHNRNMLRQHMLECDIANFLNWDVIKRTMFYEPPVEELKFLQKLIWSWPSAKMC